MPSQISLRPSTVLSGDDVQFNKTVVPRNYASNHDIEAAAVSGMIATPLTSSRKPQTMVSNSHATLDISVGTLNCPHEALPNGNPPCATNNGTCREHSNGRVVLTPPEVVPLDTGPHKTEGEHSNDPGSLTQQSNSTRLMCPELAISYTGALIGKRAGYLASKQRVLEDKVVALQERVRTRQLQLVHSHVSKQLNYYHEQESLSGTGSASTLTGSECSIDISPSPVGGVTPLPIQVDGASDDAFLPPQTAEESRELSDDVRGKGEDSFSSLESFVSRVESDGGEGGEVDTISVQLSTLERLMDVDVTDESSDEEDESTIHDQKHYLRTLWNQSRLAVGSRWVWLQRRIAELNKQIYRLDHHMREFQNRDKFVFADCPSLPSLPRYLSISNGSVIEQLRGHNGSGFISMGKTSNNGYTPGYAQYLPHLFLPDSLLGTKLQVKDLLSPSPLGRNLLQLDETSYTAARSRPLLRKVNRRIIRKKPTGRLRSSLHADTLFHPQLSMVHELPSRIALDMGVKQLLSEHSYSQLPTFSKRNRGVSLLDRLSTPQSHGLDPSHSSTPSPVNTPQSFESSRGCSSRKKLSHVHHQTSHDSIGGSPWSPGPSCSSTPSITPHQPPKKRRMTGSAPLFDIDNIVIPYSMASSTRLEKLEYKEIMTPNWREVKGQDLSVQFDESPMEEDLSDEVFAARHNRCELAEKKRFFNFVSGGGGGGGGGSGSGGHRKRSRPHSMSLLSDSPRMSPPPPRRQTITSPSPAPIEHELITQIHPVVFPWLPRTFPLGEVDEEALLSPPLPPPTITPLPSQFSSPQLFHTSTPSQPHSCTSSTLATPLGSPVTPVTSPAEWIVNPPHQLPTYPAILNHRALEHGDTPLLPHIPIILKLTKRI